MASTAPPMSVDAATVALEQVEHAVVAGTATAADLVEAKRALHLARQHEADVAVEQEGIDAIRARIDATAKVAEEVAWLEDDELAALVDQYTAAHQAALAALADARRAWTELSRTWHRHMRRVRQLSATAELPPGVRAITPQTGFDVEVETDRGVWNSASGLREDPLKYLVEGSQDIAAGRPLRSDLLGRLRRWYQRGVGDAEEQAT